MEAPTTDTEVGVGSEEDGEEDEVGLEATEVDSEVQTEVHPFFLLSLSLPSAFAQQSKGQREYSPGRRQCSQPQKYSRKASLSFHASLSFGKLSTSFLRRHDQRQQTRETTDPHYGGRRRARCAHF